MLCHSLPLDALFGKQDLFLDGSYPLDLLLDHLLHASDVVFYLVNLRIVDVFKLFVVFDLAAHAVLDERLRSLYFLEIVIGVPYLKELLILVLLVRYYLLQVLLQVQGINLVIAQLIRLCLVILFFIHLVSKFCSTFYYRAQVSRDQSFRKLASFNHS